MTISLVKLAHNAISSCLLAGDIAVDATMGNGFDTCFLAKLVGEKGVVYSFDLQQPALEATRQRLHDNGLLQRVRLIQDNHSQISSYLAADHIGLIRCAMFNLGYLPGSDKTIQTEPASTLEALNTLLSLLASPGMISLIAYTGHQGGQHEADKVKEWAQQLSKKEYRVSIQIPQAVKQSPPELILIESIK